MEAKIQQLMTTLDISREKAIQVIEDDKAIDRGEKLFSLSPKLEAGAKKARQADRKPNSAPTKREKKVDAEKRKVICAISDALSDLVNEVEIINEEREIVFHYNKRKFKVVLSCPRS